MSENSQFKVPFTGHRHLKYIDVEKSLIKVRSDSTGAIWITVGAYGLDSHAALGSHGSFYPVMACPSFPG